MAEVVFADRVRAANLEQLVRVRSSGTGGWHVDDGADPRAVAALRAAGLDGSAHRASRIDAERARSVDLIVAHDRGHARSVASIAPDVRDRIRLLREFDEMGGFAAGGRAAGTELDVPDPYYDGQSEFDAVLAMIERSVDTLVASIAAEMRTH